MSKMQYTINGISIDFHYLTTEPIIESWIVKGNDCFIDYAGLKLKFHNLTCKETHQQIFFLKNGRIVKLFDKNLVTKKEIE